MQFASLRILDLLATSKNGRYGPCVSSFVWKAFLLNKRNEADELDEAEVSDGWNPKQNQIHSHRVNLDTTLDDPVRQPAIYRGGSKWKSQPDPIPHQRIFNAADPE